MLGELGAVGGPTIFISELASQPAGDGVVVLRPPSLVVGVGASRGVSTQEVRRLLGTALKDAGLSIDSVAALATAEVKGDEQALSAVDRPLKVRLVPHPAPAPRPVRRPNPRELGGVVGGGGE